MPGRTRLLLAAALLVAGCSAAGDPAPTAAPSSTTPSSTTPSSTAAGPTAEGLAAGLLPADAFDDDAVVLPLDAADVADDATAPAVDLDRATVEPEVCRAAIRAGKPAVDGVGGFAGQFASTGAPTVAQVLTAGGPGTAVADLAAAPASCPRADLTSDVVQAATTTLEPLEVPALGDASAGLVSTTRILRDGAVDMTTTVLVAVVADGDRLLWLVGSDVGAVPDRAAFTALLQQAFEHQAQQLD